MSKAKSYEISKKLIFDAYKAVKANKGTAGIDSITMEKFDKNVKNNLYKLWNRMSSGSYFPKPVKTVAIPKSSGGTRILGIPTIEDRIAQMTCKMSLEPHVEPYFLKDSYGYRPNKSAHDAITVTRTRCWKYNWILEFDIKGLFDNINHTILMKIVRKHAKNKWEILYIERWMKAAFMNANETKEKEPEERTKGIHQGGVISPLLANLFLHYAFDSWMSREFPNVPWCRYADDGVIHCRTKKQAEYIRSCLIARMKRYALEIHPGKTTIVYCKDSNRREQTENPIQFDFLGFTFRPRKAKARNGTSFTSFLPAISHKAKNHIRQTIHSWYMIHQTENDLQTLARKYNVVIRGWLQYFGIYGRMEVAKVMRHVNQHLVMWIVRKYKRYKHKKMCAKRYLQHIAKSNPSLFAHWSVGILPMT